jgi:hypothetical protein
MMPSRLGRALLAGLACAAVVATGCAKELAVANIPAVPTPIDQEPAEPTTAATPPSAPTPRPPAATPAPAPPPRPASGRTASTPPPPPAVASLPPPAASPPPPSPAPTPAPVLAPQVGGEEERRLTLATQTRIEDAEKLVQRIDQKRLGRPQQETYSTIQSFLAKAREAMSGKDYQRAFTLADKAQVLAEELSQSLR